MNVTKIIKATAVKGRTSTAAPIIKEDYGLYLLIGGIDLPEVYEVDFSNDEHAGTSVTMVGNADGVLIPNQFIKSGKDVFAFYYHVGEDFGRTLYTIRIPNKLRPDRTDIEPTHEEQSTIDQAISALNSAVEQTAQDVVSADQSARSASGDADRAERARTAAETAQGKAEDAQESAERAKDDAETSERNASESERNAKGYAEAASEKADSIHSMTASAQTLPAGSSASASYDAETGVMSFGIPKGRDGRDGTDGTDGTDGIDGVSPTVSVTDITGGHRVVVTDKDGTKSFDVADGATGATPNLTIGTVETLEPTDDATATITGTAENPVLNLGIPQGDAGEVTLADLNSALIEKAPIITDTASGSIASFSDGADNLPLKSLIVDINPIQDLSNGDPSPENICPISGWTSVDVNHSDADMTNPTTITINLGQTVYGGHLDVISGVLTVDMAMVDLGTLTWNYVASSAFNFRAPELIGAKPPANAVVKPNAICSILPVLDYTAISAPVDGITIIFATSAQAGKVWAHSGTYTDATAFKAAMTGQTLVYELATPLTIQLTPNQVNSLLGVNNIWADSGDTSCEYRADTKLFIERLTASDSADMIADANITSGQYFMVGNNLFKATANIANGSAIIVGTNCIRKSLSEALNEINV